MKRKIDLFNQGEISEEKFDEIWKGWCAYSNWGNSYGIQKKLLNFTKHKKRLCLISPKINRLIKQNWHPN